MNNKLQVEWTGCYPCLCYGEWIIKYNDIELYVPEKVKHNCMNTFKEYDSWHFEDWDEVWTTYEDGLHKEEWLERNMNWIMKMFEKEDVEVTEELLDELYEKIKEEDWRHGSCGGCI